MSNENGGFEEYEDEYQVGDSLDRGGKFLDGTCPGCYHMVVASVKKPAVNSEGMPIENALASVQCIVAAPEQHENKTFDLTLWLPKLDSKDGGTFTQKKNDRFLAAICAIDEASLGKKVGIKWGKLAGRQFLVKLESQEREITRGKNKGQKKAFLDVSFAEFYHVDDPDAGTDYPRNQRVLKTLPKQLRRQAQASGSAKTKDVDDLDI